MEKLPMCRICLAEDIRMYVVVNKNLHELYEKLTDIPFLTEDSRPISACFICCAKLKQCHRFMTKCLKAEELFAKMMSEDYEPEHLVKQDHFKFFGSLVRTPIESINIVATGLTISIDIKEEIPAVGAREDDIVEPKEEYNVVDTGLRTIIYVKEEIPAFGARVDVELEQEHQSDDEEDNVLLKPHHFEQYSEDDVPLIAVKSEMEKETTKQKRRRVETKRPTVPEVPVLNLRRAKSEDSIPADQKTNQVSDSSYRTPKIKLKKTHICEICHCNFNKRTDLTKHVRMHASEKPYACHICSSVFSFKRYLAKHIRTHIGEKPYKCDVCQRSFSQKTHLTGHIRTHTGEKPYKCDVCQVCFRAKSNLTKHIRNHTGDKPFKCEICLACFGGKSDLTKHTRIHTGEKPYVCVVCQHSFSQKIHLTVHIRTHTGEKPYKCNVCERCFRDGSDLKKHLRIHTSEKRYHCDKCQRGFNERNNLTKHRCKLRK